MLKGMKDLRKLTRKARHIIKSVLTLAGGGGERRDYNKFTDLRI